MRRKLTVPASGVTETFKVNGRSVLIEQMGVYSGADQVPLMNLNPGTNEYPLYPRSSYPNQDGKFNQLQITGTDESAGDEIYLLSTPECLPLAINVNFLETNLATLGDTATKTASDAVQSFSDIEIQNTEGVLPNKMYIYVVGGATRGINYAFGSNPVQGDGNTGSLYWNNESEATPVRERKDDPLEIVGLNFIQAFNFIATVAGETPNLVYTLEY